MAFFYSFTDSLKSKWLQFFQTNRDWIELHMEVESVFTPDGGKRPPSYLILGVANALEPKLAQLMLPFSKLNADADTLVEVLGLHFDPNMALGNSLEPNSVVVESADDDSSEYVMDAVRHEEEINDTVADTDAGFAAAEVGMQDVDMGMQDVDMGMQDVDMGMQDVDMGMQDVDMGMQNVDMGMQNVDMGMQDVMPTDDTDAFQMSEEPQNDMADLSSAAFEETQIGADDDAFGDISFDDLKDSQTANGAAVEAEGKMDEQMFGDIGASADDAFSDVMKDVWSEESASQNGEASNQFGEEMSTDAIDTTEMAEIFSQN
ncbi:MAG: DUF5331 domain-containing protein [Calothrix sp. MO_167.B12]|nr:DUF5331 domain-containing protein [Calothrix sp. MO_167.B12]